MKSILIIEDEKDLSRILKMELEFEGYRVTVKENGRAGLMEALENTYDIILLDLMLPEMDGLEVTRRLRLVKQTVHIIIMTAKDSVMDIVSGLDRGADDYLTKPFAIEELLARMRVFFRKQEIEQARITNQQSVTQQVVPEKGNVLNIIIDKASKSATYEGHVVQMSSKELDLLAYLLEHQNEIVTRADIMANVWAGKKERQGSNIVDVYIRYLRRKLDRSLIRTIRGVGYIFGKEV
ncbi:response regulator transcription factor [Streptococcus suis]|uniref:Transcriptional regulatory protein DltR n=1 Tax=Streptococcus suis TaxID=1307 RepID=A0A9X4MPT0_STRSU|nr:response regulator transcription factor [Streptococcus suis]MBY5025876.1 response regulator transcription factor [Streptococcus suis]MCK3935952.1 response regulator transcription factor [Streptococcus suis]MDG4525995.1 response regulator transcription factor [Streptococcus suis]MDG4528381.1 response regulator transcription factor [Streptococcus suis]NQK55019.1 response regulator transcription factor [Streptococcus suis]